MADKLLVLISWLIGAAVLAVIVGVVAVGALAATGDFGKPNECISDTPGEPARGVSNEAPWRLQWDAKWKDFDGKLDGGQQASVTFTESEVTSRANAFLNSKDAPVDEVIICFHNGDAEARGKVKLPAVGDIPVVGKAFETNVKLRGTVDMSGDHPQIVITDIEAGNLPKKITDQVEDQVVDIINSRLDDLNLEHQFDPVKFSEGAAEVSGKP